MTAPPLHRMRLELGQVVLLVHFAWALWMIAGVFHALAGFVWTRLWGWRVFRTLHLAGILLTATVPVWAGGLCPLTRWEADAQGLGGEPEPFLVYWAGRLLYWDLDPMWLSIVAAMGAAATLLIYILRPPWKVQSR